MKMELSNLVTLAVILFFSGSAYAQTEECTDGLQQCLNAYLGDVFQHVEQQNVDLICTDLNVFVKCVMDLDCGLRQQDREQAINQIKSELVKQGFDCKIDLESVTSRPGPRTTIHPDLTTKPKTCAGAMKVCTQNYIDEVFDKAGAAAGSSSNAWLCPVINVYVDCLIYSPCKLENVEEVINKEVKKQLDQNGIKCEINYGRGGNTATGLHKTALMTILVTTFLAGFNMFF